MSLTNAIRRGVCLGSVGCCLLLAGAVRARRTSSGAPTTMSPARRPPPRASSCSSTSAPNNVSGVRSSIRSPSPTQGRCPIPRRTFHPSQGRCRTLQVLAGGGTTSRATPPSSSAAPTARSSAIRKGSSRPAPSSRRLQTGSRRRSCAGLDGAGNFQEAGKAVAASNYARALELLRGVVEDGKDRPVQARARDDRRPGAAGRRAARRTRTTLEPGQDQ